MPRRSARRLLVALCLSAAIWLTDARTTRAGVDVWTRHGPDGGFIVSLAARPGDTLIYAATANAGVFSTVDGGSHWDAMNDGLTTVVIKDLTVGPDGAVYAATLDGVFWAPDGTHWAPAGNGLTGEPAVVAVDPSARGALYAGTYEGRIFKTVDAAGTWTDASVGLPTGGYAPITLIAVDPSTPSTVYAGTQTNGLFVSTDAGATWGRPALGHGFPSYSAIRSLVFDPANSSTFYIAVDGAGVFKTTDRGITFHSSSAGLTSLYASAMALSPSDGALFVAVRPGDLFKSLDAGVTWVSVANDLGPSPYLTTLLADASVGGTVYAGLAGAGVFKTIDAGASWRAADHGLTGAYTQEIVVDPTAPDTLYAGTFGGIAKSTDGGVTWTRVDAMFGPREVESFAFDPSNSATIYAGLDFEGGLFETIDAGGSWQAVGTQLANVQVPTIVVDPRNPAIIYVATDGAYADGVMKTVDGGATWTPSNAGMITPDCLKITCLHPSVPALVIDPTTPDTLYAVVHFFEDGEAIFKSADGAATWTVLGTVPAPFIFSIAVNPRSPETLYAGTLMGVFKSDDAGLDWRPVNTGLHEVYALAIDPRSPNTVYAGTNAAGVYRSLDGGETWTTFNSGFTARTVLSLAIDQTSPNRLHAATDAGVFDIEIRCGNGRLDPGEECDDGDTAAGDCCSPSCTFEPAGSICFDDGSPCTADACDAGGTCTHTFPPDIGCAAAVPHGASIEIVKSTDPSRDRVRWRWTGDRPPMKPEFGNPLSATSYTLCVGNEAGQMLFESTVSAGGICGGRPCWRELRGGYRYRSAAPMQRVHLGSWLGLAGRGRNVGLSSLPASLPVVTRLVRLDAPICWDAVFGSPDRDDEESFRARSD